MYVYILGGARSTPTLTRSTRTRSTALIGQNAVWQMYAVSLRGHAVTRSQVDLANIWPPAGHRLARQPDRQSLAQDRLG